MKSLLSTALPGFSGLIIGFVPGNDLIERRVIEMGIVPGAHFTVRHKALLGDPIAIEIRGGVLALGIKEASVVEIESLSL